jgi:hypothetical protein
MMKYVMLLQKNSKIIMVEEKNAHDIIVLGTSPWLHTQGLFPLERFTSTESSAVVIFTGNCHRGRL